MEKLEAFSDENIMFLWFRYAFVTLLLTWSALNIISSVLS